MIELSIKSVYVSKKDSFDFFSDNENIFDPVSSSIFLI